MIYELHVGTFTPAGTLYAVAERLPALRDLGVTAVELMPVAPFPGARLCQLLDPARARVAAVATLLAPQIPLLFMGEEHGELAPFLYFTSHGDPELARAVTLGQRREFPEMAHREDIPDPQAESTFARSRLDWSLRKREGHREMLGLYRELIRLRSMHPSLGCLPARVTCEGELIRVEREAEGESSAVYLWFGDGPLEATAGPGELLLDTRGGGSLSAVRPVGPQSSCGDSGAEVKTI